MLETLAVADVPLELLLGGSSFWSNKDKLLKSVQEVLQHNTHIYPLAMDDELLQIPIQGAQWVFAISHISFFWIVQ